MLLPIKPNPIVAIGIFSLLIYYRDYVLIKTLHYGRVRLIERMGRKWIVSKHQQVAVILNGNVAFVYLPVFSCDSFNIQSQIVG